MDGLDNGATEACTRDTNEPSELRLMAAGSQGVIENVFVKAKPTGPERSPGGLKHGWVS